MIRPRRQFVGCAIAGAALCALAMQPAAAQDASAVSDVVELQLRIEWGGGAARRWVVEGAIDGGALREPRPLGVETDEPGSMWIDEGRWFVEARTPRTYDGVDLVVSARRTADLVLDFADVDDPSCGRLERIAIASLIDGTFHTDLDDAGNRLVVRRAPGDRLRVEFEHPSLVFGTGEVLSLQVRPHELGLASGTSVQLTAALQPARQTQQLWSGTAALTAPDDDSAWPAVPITLRLPEVEGVYDVALEATPRLPAAAVATTVRRKVQVVVVSPQAPPRRTVPDPTLLNELLEIDPASPAWAERLKQMTTLPGNRRTQLGNVRPTTRTIGRTAYAVLPPTPETDDLGWQAFPLPIARPGTLHIVEVEFPSSVAQSLSVSLVEPNALGAVTPLGTDAGFYVDEHDAEATSRRLSRRFVVWPQTTAPLLVLTNRRRDASAVFGKIRLYGARTAGSVPYLTHDADAPPQLAATPRDDAPDAARLAAAYYDRPLFPENFGASSCVDRAEDGTGRCLDDWQTYYDGAVRLVEYLRHVGCNGVMLTVVADGGAIYPSALLEPTPRYDDGAFFSTGQDPVRKDVVELLMRLCDREGLTFVPAVQFTAPLPRLEELRRGGSTSLEPRGTDGRTWNEVQAVTGGGAGPRYNPLDPEVRDATQGVVAELTERYAAHRSWGGVAVHLSADGYALLPGIEWGVDAATLAAFARETQTALPRAAATGDVATAVLERHRDTWLAWRQSTLARWYDDLAKTAGADGASRKLYLIAAHAWRRPDLQQRLQPALPTRAAGETTLAERGINVAELTTDPRFHWLRPTWDGPLGDPAPQGANLTVNRDESLDRLALEAAAPGSMLFHEPQLERLESLERQSPFQPAHVRLVTEAAGAGAAGRRRLVRQLAAFDSTAFCYGGWLLPLGEEDGWRRVAEVMQALPAERFTTLKGGPSHVVVRTLSRGERTYAYLVNDSPWPTTVTLDAAVSPEVAWKWFGANGAKANLREIEGRRTLVAVLDPYDVVGGAFSQADVALSNPQATVPVEVDERLDARIRDLWARCGSLQSAPPEIALANADFETSPTDAAAVPGWETTAGADAGVTAESPHTGRNCLRLTCAAAGGAGITSSRIVTPVGGRASISVWLRSPRGTAPPLRLSLEGRHDGRPYVRSATIGDDGAQSVGAEWRQFVFPLTDLPTAGLADVRLHIELTEPGEAHLDDVRITALEFTAQERLELSKAISLAELRLRGGEQGECARLLEGYWPRFLTAYVPPAPSGGGDTPVAARPTPKPAPPAADASPGMRDRLRKWLPEILR